MDKELDPPIQRWTIARGFDAPSHPKRTGPRRSKRTSPSGLFFTHLGNQSPRLDACCSQTKTHCAERAAP